MNEFISLPVEETIHDLHEIKSISQVVKVVTDDTTTLNSVHSQQESTIQTFDSTLTSQSKEITHQLSTEQECDSQIKTEITAIINEIQVQPMGLSIIDLKEPCHSNLDTEPLNGERRNEVLGVELTSITNSADIINEKIICEFMPSIQDKSDQIQTTHSIQNTHISKFEGIMMTNSVDEKNEALIQPMQSFDNPTALPDNSIERKVEVDDDESSTSSDNESDSDSSQSEGEIAIINGVCEEDEVLPEVLQTKNESVLPLVPKCDITLSSDAVLVSIGVIHAIVDCQVVVEASLSGDYKVLDTETLLVLEDKSILGRISDTFGKVSKPMYSVRFNEEEECKLFKVGMLVFYSPDYANFVFTQTLKVKGTDASNLHDEEIGDDDKEFSDDDAELEHKRRKKMAKKECEPKSRKERPFTQNDRNPHGGNSNRNGSFNLYDESRQSSLGKDEGEPNKNGYRSNYSEINPNHTLNHQHQNSHLNRQYHTNYINNNSQNQNNPNQSYQSSNVNQNNLNYVPYMPSSGQYYAMNNNYGMNVMQQHQNQQQQDRSHNHHQNHQQYQQHHGDINQEMMQAIYLQQFQQMQQMYGTNHEYVRNPNGYEANNR